jgi:N-acetylglutamate synthase-like GNAT family acetyltransferase
MERNPVLHVLALQQVGAYAGDGQWNDDVRDIKRVYLQHSAAFLVGVYEGRIVAMGALRRPSDERAEIKRMRVHPDVQGRGFGQTILTALEQQALILGYKTLYVSTSTLQKAALSLYRKNGFQEVGEKMQRGFHDILFEKSIASSIAKDESSSEDKRSSSDNLHYGEPPACAKVAMADSCDNDKLEGDDEVGC